MAIMINIKPAGYSNNETAALLYADKHIQLAKIDSYSNAYSVSTDGGKTWSSGYSFSWQAIESVYERDTDKYYQVYFNMAEYSFLSENVEA